MGRQAASVFPSFGQMAAQFPKVDPRPGLRWTAWENHSQAQFEAAQGALPISPGASRGGEEGAHTMLDQSLSHGGPR